MRRPENIIAVFVAQKLHAQISEDVVYKRLGERNVFIAGDAGRLKARVFEFLYKRFQWHARLQRHRDEGSDDVKESRDRAPLLGDRDKSLADFFRIRIHTDREITLVIADGKFVRDGRPLVRKLHAGVANRSEERRV